MFLKWKDVKGAVGAGGNHLETQALSAFNSTPSEVTPLDARIGSVSFSLPFSNHIPNHLEPQRNLLPGPKMSTPFPHPHPCPLHQEAGCAFLPQAELNATGCVLCWQRKFHLLSGGVSLQGPLAGGYPLRERTPPPPSLGLAASEAAAGQTSKETPHPKINHRCKLLS